MSLPRHLAVAVSPGRVQMTTCFYMGQQLERRISHQSALPRWWHPVWSFVTCCPQGFRCLAEHQLCWASSSLLWCNGLPAFYILHFTFLSGQSRNTSGEFGAHLPSCQRAIQLDHSVAQLIPISAWKIPWAHSIMRSQCKDLVWFILKRPTENLLNQAASGWNERNSQTHRVLCLEKNWIRWKKKRCAEAPAPNWSYFPSGFNQVNKTTYRLSQKMSHQSKALEGKVQESCYN